MKIIQIPCHRTRQRCVRMGGAARVTPRSYLASPRAGTSLATPPNGFKSNAPSLNFKKETKESYFTRAKLVRYLGVRIVTLCIWHITTSMRFTQI